MLHPPEVHPQAKTQRNRSLSFLRNPIPLLFAAWGGLIVVAAFGLIGLVNPDQSSDNSDLWSENNNTNLSSEDAVNPLPEPEVVIAENSPEFIAPLEPSAVFAPDSSELPLWTFGAIALGCAGGSLFISFALKSSNFQSPKQKKVKRVRKKPPTSAPKARDVHPHHLDPQVTILGNEFAHPLDSDQDNLAVEMDLRKRQSLSSLLQNW